MSDLVANIPGPFTDDIGCAVADNGDLYVIATTGDGELRAADCEVRPSPVPGPRQFTVRRPSPAVHRHTSSSVCSNTT